MDEQPVKIWVCKKRKPYTDFFITENPEEVKQARKQGFRCDRWHRMEKIKNGG